MRVGAIVRSGVYVLGLTWASKMLPPVCEVQAERCGS
jgi:hypothetical protein